MRDLDLWGNAPSVGVDRHLCSVDPISMALGGLVGLAGSAFGGNSSSSAAAPAPTTPPPQAAPQKTPPPKQATPGGSSFVGGVPAPPPATGNKSLLGQ